MQLLVIFLSLLMPFIMPVMEYNAEKFEAQLRAPAKQPQTMPAAQFQPRPYITYHDGRWWKFENNQWYVWVEERR